MTGIITDIQRFSIHDGPGIRTLIFFKGCPLRCPWCSNPETQSEGPQLLYYAFKCIHCGNCSGACSRSAVNLGRTPPVAADKCILCGDCVRACPSAALRLVGEQVSAEQIVEVVEKDRLFYQNSGGGVTLSGGEPFMQSGFLGLCLEALQNAGIHTAVETCGFAEWRVLERLEKQIDLFLFDIKLLDAEEHARLLGATNEPVIANLRRLAALRDRIVVRIPVIPGYTASGENIPRIFDLVASLPNVRTVHLLPYHALGKSKYGHVGRRYPAEGAHTPTPEQLEDLVAAAARVGLRCTIGG